MRPLTLILLTLLFVLGCAGPKPDAPPTTSPPSVPTEPTPEPPTVEPPTVEPTPGRTSEVFKEVDKYFRKTELSKVRTSTYPTDTCVETKTFADAIDSSVNLHMKSTKNHVHRLAPYYDVPSDLNKHVPTSLKSHPLCTGFTSSNLKDVLKNVPSSSVIAKMNKFSELSNSLRNDEEGFKKLWKKMFGCLSYIESLTTADTSSSYDVAKFFNFPKPNGVKFYDDPRQSQASRYNIGLYQFTPDYRGNVNPCLRNWNATYKCDLALNSSQSVLVKVFGSGQQVFNAFCGVSKIVGTFAIQQNSTASKAIFKPEEGKAPGNRCVTPFIWSGWGYNHFGPMQNSTGKNLDKLLSCALN